LNSKIAFVFPGQGSQAVGMGKGFAEDRLTEANQILGFDLAKLCFEGPADELKKTEITQPAILTVSVAAFETLKIKPEVVAGHSLGEYSALVAAGAISFKDAVKIVYLRGKFMQAAVPVGMGAMAAVLGASRELINEICQKIGGVQLANLNSPDQLVISGKAESVQAASKELSERGAKRVIPLKVSAPFHSELMKPAADKLKVELDKIEIKDAEIPIVANVTADFVTSKDMIRELLIKQVTGSVLWEDSVKKMISNGVNTFVEVGPGNVLAGLIRKINASVIIKGWEEMKNEA